MPEDLEFSDICETSCNHAVCLSAKLAKAERELAQVRAALSLAAPFVESAKRDAVRGSFAAVDALKAALPAPPEKEEK